LATKSKEKERVCVHSSFDDGDFAHDLLITIVQAFLAARPKHQDISAFALQELLKIYECKEGSKDTPGITCFSYFLSCFHLLQFSLNRFHNLFAIKLAPRLRGWFDDFENSVFLVRRLIVCKAVIDLFPAQFIERPVIVLNIVFRTALVATVSGASSDRFGTTSLIKVSAQYSFVKIVFTARVITSKQNTIASLL